MIAGFNSSAVFVAFSAILLHLIQKHVPPSEIVFANVTCICCLVFFALTSDPITFWESLPFLRSLLPRKLQTHISSSIECLREGERRVAALEEKNSGGSDNSDETAGDKRENNVSNNMILAEICKRMQWRWVLPSTITGVCLKLIEYQKPKVIGDMMDAVVKEGASMDTAFWPHIRHLVLFVIFDYIFISMREYYKHAAAHRYRAEVCTDMLRNILHQEQDFIHSDRHSAGFIQHLRLETNRMQRTVNETAPRIFFGIFSCVGGILTLARVDYRLAMVGLGLKLPILSIFQELSRKDIVKYSKLYDASAGDAARLSASILRPEVIHLLQSHVAQNILVDLYRAKQDEFINYLKATHFRQTLLCMLPHGLRNVESVLLLAMGLSSVLKKEISIGEYHTFRQRLNLLGQGPKELTDIWNDIATIRLSAAVYFELMYRESKIISGNRVPDDISGGLELSLNRVSFSYQLNPKVKVLDSVDLHLKPGKVVALCGGSGGGKTTITRLLKRFYDPTKGNIELNGIDIRELDISWLRTSISVVDQDPILLPDMSIHENIALGLSKDLNQGDEVVIRDKVIKAAKLAEAHEFILSKCESGYDTQLQFAQRLSGGQRQRIALARALISQAHILICDEITSALDSETERSVMGTLLKAVQKKGKTVLVIAHRLSTIRNADEILFLEHGKVIEKGTHEELQQQNGRYSSYLETLKGH